MPKTLVEKAKDFAELRKFKYTEEELDLAIAWLERRVSSTQAHKVLFGEKRKIIPANVIYKFATILRKATEDNKIKIVKL